MSLLADLLRGRGAHIDPVGCVEDLSGKDASRVPDGLPYSVWRLVGHLNFWMEWELKWIEGVQAPYPEPDTTWLDLSSPTDELLWHHEVALLTTSIGQLVTLADARASTLQRIVRPDTGQTVETILWQMVVHNSYHVGQIVTVRRALGLWPPATR